ncbi:MAG: DUF4365 domain-containing protein [Candidatus Omnitrophota bacterium]
MTEEQTKEELSNNYLSILTYKSGYKLDKPKDTGGVDFVLSFDQMRISRDGKKRFCQSAKRIDLQLKTTTEKSIIESDRVIKYDLEVKNYEDLISRKEERIFLPLILILFILPNDKNEWVQLRDEEMALRKCAYWYCPENDFISTDNKRTVRIEIPIKNKLNLNTIKNLFEKFFGESHVTM